MSKTHWKKAFNPNYLGAYSLEPGQELIVEIDTIGTQKVMNGDGKEEECLVAHLKGHKPLIVNKTNAKSIAKVAGSNFLEDWPGTQIQIHTAKVKAFGSVVDALCVRDFKPKGKDKLTGERFNKMCEQIKAGKFDKASALSRFELTASQKEKIQAI